jgi:broad specificity phosphatase PhoE
MPRDRESGTPVISDPTEPPRGPCVWWIRHGESVRNAGLRTLDTYNAPLTARGEAQARSAASLLPRRPDLIVHSSFRRAIQTSEPALDRFGGTPVQTWDVFEYHFLCDEKTKNTTRAEREPMVREYWERMDPEFVHGVAAESFATFWRRVDSMIDRMRERSEPWIVVYTHQQFMLGVMFRLMVGPHEPSRALMTAFYHWVEALEIPNASMVETRLARTDEPARRSVVGGVVRMDGERT